jgi:hypothetical protein
MSKSKVVFISSVFLFVLVGSALAVPTYTVYATREGLVGGTTANGHVIVTNDHFVALPSRVALDCNGCSNRTVKLTYNGRTATRSVWDIGPWNINDDYWNDPREYFTGLARGVPEAEAAYYDGYNGGKDGFGRTVANGAGIDLADGTFWGDLQMTNNDWVSVKYNFDDQTPAIVIDNASSDCVKSSNWWNSSYSSGYYGSNYSCRMCASVGDAAYFKKDLATDKYNVRARWVAGSNRASSAAYVVYHDGGSTTVRKNQRVDGGYWNCLGTYEMTSGYKSRVALSCWTSSGTVVIADAVGFHAM